MEPRYCHNFGMRQSDLDRISRKRGTSAIIFTVVLSAVFGVLGMGVKMMHSQYFEQAAKAPKHISAALVAGIASLPQQAGTTGAVFSAIWIVAIASAALAMFCTRP